MFSAIKNFLNRHKRKFVVTGAVFGGLYFLTGYAQRKLREYQEKEAKKFFQMTRKKQHFESTERTCNQTILTLSGIVSESILGLLKTDEILDKLQRNQNNKKELWEQMKVIIFTRISVLAYALSILQVTLRVQLNVMGGYLYRDSIHEQEEPFVDSAMQAEYLSLCHHFVGRGVEDLVKQIEKAVKRVVTPVSLKKKISLSEVEQLLWSIQTVLCADVCEGNPVKKLVCYLIDNADITQPKLDRMLRETIDLLESDEVVTIAMMSVTCSFSAVYEEITKLFFKLTPVPITKNHLEIEDVHVMDNRATTPDDSELFNVVNNYDMYFVRLLPQIHDLITKKICKDNKNIPEVITQHLARNDKLKLLGANIYEEFSSGIVKQI